jgi:hypothetical protein
MTDLTAVIHDLIDVFEGLRLPYAIMGGIAVRAHGIPRPTYGKRCQPPNLGKMRKQLA